MRDGEGQPIAGATVAARAASAVGEVRTSFRDPWMASQRTDRLGNADLTVPTAGEFVVQVRESRIVLGESRVEVRTDGIDAETTFVVSPSQWRNCRIDVAEAFGCWSSGDGHAKPFKINLFQVRVLPRTAGFVPLGEEWQSPWLVDAPAPNTDYGIEARITGETPTGDKSLPERTSLGGVSVTTKRIGPSRWEIAPVLSEAAASRRRWFAAQVRPRLVGKGAKSGRTVVSMTLTSARVGSWSLDLPFRWQDPTSLDLGTVRWWVDPSDGPWTLSWGGPATVAGSQAATVPAPGDEAVEVRIDVDAAKIEPSLERVEVVDGEGKALPPPVTLHWRESDDDGSLSWRQADARDGLTAAGQRVTPVAPWHIGTPVDLPVRGETRVVAQRGGYVQLVIARPPDPTLGLFQAERVDEGWLGFITDPSELRVKSPDEALLQPEAPAPPKVDVISSSRERIDLRPQPLTLRTGCLLGPLPPGPNALRFRVAGVEIGTTTVNVVPGEIVVLSIR